MMIQRSRLLLLFLLAASLPLSAAESHGPQLVATPRAQPLPVSATNRPFLTASRAQQPVDLAALGYAETEYLVRGLASIYEWSGMPQAGALAVRDANVPYTTRILVRRPRDARKASGIVIVELLDASSLYDTAPLWGLSAAHFARRGHVWVGVTVTPAAAKALRTFDPVRYGSLSFGFAQPDGCMLNPLASAPDTENGLAWDAIAQVGALLRSSSKENPLLDIAPRQIVAAGYALAGGYITTFANALHRVQRLGDGAPVFDAYLNAAGSTAVPINQCAAPLAADDPRRHVLPRAVPFVIAMTEADFHLDAALRRDDSDEPGVFRLYEIPGAGHSGSHAAGMPVAADLAIAGFGAPAEGLCVEPRSDYPVGFAFNAIWQQLADWLLLGEPMLRAPRLETDAARQVVRDANGNALGGWRLPELDLPLAAYAGAGTPRENNERARQACALTGVKRPFDPATLQGLYRSRAEYLRLFHAAVDQAVIERRLTPEDGATLKAPSRSVPSF